MGPRTDVVIDRLYYIQHSVSLSLKAEALVIREPHSN